MRELIIDFDGAVLWIPKGREVYFHGKNLIWNLKNAHLLEGVSKENAINHIKNYEDHEMRRSLKQLFPDTFIEDNEGHFFSDRELLINLIEQEIIEVKEIAKILLKVLEEKRK